MDGTQLPAGLAAWDTETFPIRRALLAPPMVCVSVAPRPCVFHRDDALPVLRKLLRGPSVLANAAFDLAVVLNEFPELSPLVWEALWDDRIYDVLLRQKLLDIAEGRYRGWTVREQGGEKKRYQYKYTLEETCWRHGCLDLDKENPWRLKYGDLFDVPVNQWPEEAHTYARDDAIGTLQCCRAQEKADEHGALAHGQEFPQVRAHLALHLMSCWGIRTDAARVGKLDRELREEHSQVKARLQAAGLVRGNGTKDTKAAKALVYQCLRDATPKTPKGAVKTDAETLLSTGHPALADYAAYTGIQKILGTYVTALWRGIDIPIQSRYEPLAETGRTTSSAPNVQNPPRKEGVRECFVPRAGHVFIFCDYDKAELCSLAEICYTRFGHSRLGDLLNEGKDPHTDFGGQLAGISYEEAVQRHRSGHDEFCSVHRQLAKVGNFGIAGGLGARMLAKYAKANFGLELSETEAKALKDRWLRAFPEMVEYFAWISDLCGGGHAFIEQHLSKRLRGDIPYTVTCNTFFQGLTADGAKAALAEITREQFSVPSSPLYGSHCVLFVHDEIAVEALESRAHAAALRQRDVMVHEFRKFHPHLHEAIEANPVITRLWSKKAKQVWKNEQLVPWGPSTLHA